MTAAFVVEFANRPPLAVVMPDSLSDRLPTVYEAAAEHRPGGKVSRIRVGATPSVGTQVIDKT